jgi:hypothetical protein
VFDKIHFAGSICIPQIDRENVEGRINLTRPCQSVKADFPKKTIRSKYLISISFSVCASLTIKRMQGGGVIGLRS